MLEEDFAWAFQFQNMKCFNSYRLIDMMILISIIFSGFYDSKDKSIIEYAANVDVVFSNKACAHILERARELMKRPIHVTVCVTPLNAEGPLVIQVFVKLYFPAL